MEEILRKLQKEASGSKYKAIKESCTWALGKRGRGAPGTWRPVGLPRPCSRPRGSRAGWGPDAWGLPLSCCYGCISLD